VLSRAAEESAALSSFTAIFTVSGRKSPLERAAERRTGERLKKEPRTFVVFFKRRGGDNAKANTEVARVDWAYRPQMNLHR